MDDLKDALRAKLRDVNALVTSLASEGVFAQFNWRNVPHPGGKVPHVTIFEVTLWESDDPEKPN